MTEWDYKCMRLAIQIAKIFPDPVRGKAVGAVVSDNDKIVTIGFRQTYIKADGRHDCIHAEDMALSTVHEKLCGLTLYVTLEPCLQRLKSPTWDVRESCTDQIIRSDQIERVVIGLPDHKFGGAAKLRNRGIQVDFMEDEEIISDCMKFMWDSIIPPGQEENLRQAEENARFGGSH